MMRVPADNLESGTFGHTFGLTNYFDLCTLWKAWKNYGKDRKRRLLSRRAT